MRWRNASASGPRGLDLAHVADVEHADLGPHRDVLLADPAYCTGISQPANGTSRAPGGGMAIVQRSALQRLGAGGHRGRTLAALSARFSGYIAGR